jgi:hypothetical protein
MQSDRYKEGQEAGDKEQAEEGGQILQQEVEIVGLR